MWEKRRAISPTCPDFDQLRKISRFSKQKSGQQLDGRKPGVSRTAGNRMDESRAVGSRTVGDRMDGSRAVGDWAVGSRVSGSRAVGNRMARGLRAKAKVESLANGRAGVGGRGRTRRRGG